MASKMCLAFVLLAAVSVVFAKTEEEPMERNFQEDFDAATKPLLQAYETLNSHFDDLIEKVREYELYKSVRDSLRSRLEEAKATFLDAYDRLIACKQVFLVQKTPAKPKLRRIPK